jgi:HEPN domain-containing protein
MAELAGSPATFFEDYCFQCQQAAEKALKAVHVFHGIDFRFTHSIDELTTSLRKHGLCPPETPPSIDDLTRYATETRYPGPYEPLTRVDFEEALEAARVLVHWAKEIIEGDHA